MDCSAYNALLRALRRGRFKDFEKVPIGGTRKLLSPLSGLAFNIEGVDSPATELQAPACIRQR